MKLLESAYKFIEKERLLGLLDSVLVGVSGGKDSMCLLHVLQYLGYKISVAHVNYKLRGAESDKDEALVAEYCQKHQIKCHIYRVTEQDSQMLQAQNFQECARDLRYQYFEKLIKENSYTKIATAHHQNDVTETFLMNAMRGSGTGGLRSIQSINGIIVRPLLHITREEISNYVDTSKIPYRTDASNKSNKYSRNYIRNKVIPSLSKRWPGAVSGIGKSSKLLSDENQLLQYLIDQEKPKWVSTTDTATQIGPLSAIALTPGHESMMWYLLQAYGLTMSSIADILDTRKTSGNDFSTLSHAIIVDRDFIKIEAKQSATPTLVHIDTVGVYQASRGTLQLQPCKDHDRRGKNEEVVDSAKVLFPLTLRQWKQGDKWKALGMKGRNKKVSDYLIDQKVDRLAKNKVLVLEDANGDIIWLVGHRISELIKTSEETDAKLLLTWKPEL